MRPHVPVVLLCLMFAVPGVAEAKGEKPSFALGDFWNYAYTTAAIDGTLRTTITGTRDIDVGGTALSHTVWTGNATGRGTYDDGTYVGPIQMRGHTYLDTTTLYTVEESLEVDGTITPKGGGTSHTLHISSTVTYDPPLQLQRFPMAPGQAWNANSQIHEVTVSTLDGTLLPGYPVDKNSTTQSAFSVGAKDNRTVRAGTFEVFVVKNATIEYWYADAVGSSIKMIDNSGSDPTIFELLEYNFQGAPRPSSDSGPATTQPAGGLPGLGAPAVVAVMALAVLAAPRRRP